MSWSPGRTWASGEQVTSYHFNTYVRDNMTTLDNGVFFHDGVSSYSYGIDDGHRRHFIFAYSYPTGAGKATALTTDVEAPECTFVIPAKTLSQPGDALIVRGWAYSNTNAGAKSIKIGVGTMTTLVMTYYTGVSAYYHIWEGVLRRRTQTTGSWTAVSYQSPGIGTVAADYLCNQGISTGVDWDADQFCKTYLNNDTASSIQLYDVSFEVVVGTDGTVIG